MSAIDVDIAILGAGPGGYATALRAAEHGLGVVMIEAGEVGGNPFRRKEVSEGDTVDRVVAGEDVRSPFGGRLIGLPMPTQRERALWPSRVAPEDAAPVRIAAVAPPSPQRG